MERIVPQFGQGFYTATDTANILDIDYNKVGYWFRKYVKGEFERHSNYRYYYENDKVTAVNFHTLIEIYVFDFFRQNKIPTKSIILAHQELSKYLNSPYPFCHTDFLLLSGKDILYRIEQSIFEAKQGSNKPFLNMLSLIQKRSNSRIVLHQSIIRLVKIIPL